MGRLGNSRSSKLKIPAPRTKKKTLKKDRVETTSTPPKYTPNHHIISQTLKTHKVKMKNIPQSQNVPKIIPNSIPTNTPNMYPKVYPW